MENTLHQDSQTFLEKHLSEYVNLLEQMVKINSFTQNPGGVNALGQFTAEVFGYLGFKSEFTQSVNPLFGKHLVLKRKGTGDVQIGLVTHLDTVFPPEEEAANNFHWRVEGKRVYGPGTVDIKGGTVIIYMVLDLLRKFHKDIFEKTNWVILCDASEETLSEDFGDLCLAELDGGTRACLVFEGGSVKKKKAKVVTGRKGMLVYDVKVNGRSAHAGSAHEMGANAVVQLAHTIQSIASFTNYDDQITFNVGTVKGGVVTNRVPHSAEARVEMRAFAPDIFEDGLSKVMALKHDSRVSSQDGFSCEVNIAIRSRTQPWPKNERTEELFNIWHAVGQELGYEVVPEMRGGLSDGNHTWSNIPTLDGLGPSGGNAHCSERSADGSKDQEYAVIPSFIPKTMLNAAGLVKLLS